MLQYGPDLANIMYTAWPNITETSAVTIEAIRTMKIPCVHHSHDYALPSANHRPRPYTWDGVALKQYHPDFAAIVGTQPRCSLLVSTKETSEFRCFQEGCAYVEEKDEIYATSGFLASSTAEEPMTVMSKIELCRHGSSPDGGNSLIQPSDVVSLKWICFPTHPLAPFPAGAIPYGGRGGVLFCSQGAAAADKRLPAGGGGLFYMRVGRPDNPVPLLTSFFGRAFNSIASVARDARGRLWFVDSGGADIRPMHPQLPSQVYMFSSCGGKGELRVVAGGFREPRGIAVSPDSRTVYVTETEALRQGTFDPTLEASIYAFDIVGRSSSPFLANKRLFAYAAKGVPTTVLCDAACNVYASCGDGIEVWSPGGVPLGLIEVAGGCSSFCFGKPGELFVCASQRLWRVQLEAERKPPDHQQGVGES